MEKLNSLLTLSEVGNLKKLRSPTYLATARLVMGDLVLQCEHKEKEDPFARKRFILKTPPRQKTISLNNFLTPDRQ